MPTWQSGFANSSVIVTLGLRTTHNPADGPRIANALESVVECLFVNLSESQDVTQAGLIGHLQSEPMGDGF